MVSSQFQCYNTAKDVIMNICHFEDRKAVGKFSVMVWTLWNNRNTCVWNNAKETGQQLCPNRNNISNSSSSPVLEQQLAFTGTAASTVAETKHWVV
ncbi:hypothetical protein QL285_046461 [Trifolium repens]|nr:hypothetical protein QL285_046461 [Trifolium repens]